MAMTNDELWREFERSGKVCDYLLYRSAFWRERRRKAIVNDKRACDR